MRQPYAGIRRHTGEDRKQSGWRSDSIPSERASERDAEKQPTHGKLEDTLYSAESPRVLGPAVNGE